MALKIENLDCRMGSTNILRSCSIEVQDAEIVCLVGRNGAGKSSLLKNIIGLYPSQAGQIIFNDRDITGASCHDRVQAGIAYAPEDSKLFPGLTVEENIRIGLWVSARSALARSDDFDIQKAVKVFPAIEKLLPRRADTLSGGEKKMVSIARALALRPSLVLLDESFEGLSPLVVNAFSLAMENIKKELGVSILLAESNIRDASNVAERSYIIDRGEIIFEGLSEEILQNEKLMKLIGK